MLYTPAATMFRMIIGMGFHLAFIFVINLVSIVILYTYYNLPYTLIFFLSLVLTL